ncbi:hypothetical protein [Anaeroselena agilis]|uniref:Uncharacterized protein n=1 Tax=Anaeroselena agilis TaxID=3063788 RepID=A0ABU3P1G2_9FIRM|nr:hypothetical protein [Selenomonadales bacterium 4137-cl]
MSTGIVISRKGKIALAAGLVAVFALGLWWNSLLARMASAAQDQLVAKANEHVDGKVTVGKMEFSLSGSLVARDVTVTDRKDAVVGRSERIAVRFGVGDVLAGRADLSAVKSVTLENAAMTLTSGKDGRWNWEELIKAGKDREMAFRGTVTVKQGTLLVRSAGGERKLEAVNGSVDFARYPAMAFDLTAKAGSTPLAAKGSWTGGGDGEVTVMADQAALADLPLALLGAGDLKLTGGTAKNVSATVRQKDGRLSLAAEGTVEKLAASVAGYALSEGAGKVSMADGKVTLKEAAVLVNGQKVTAGGTLTPADAALTLNLDVAATAFEAGALGSTPLKGPLAFQAKVSGTTANPAARGTFTMDRGSFGAVAFADGRGSFAYSGGTLTLSDTRATAWDGALTVQGSIVPATQQYDMAASGRGVDAALLSEKDIRGRTDFDARLQGKGASGGHAVGNFSMGEGSFSGIPFLSMTGDFVKQGEQMNFHNVVVNTVGGSFSAEGLTEGAVVRLRRTAGTTAASPREVLEKVVTDKLGDKLKQFLPGR